MAEKWPKEGEDMFQFSCKMQGNMGVMADLPSLDITGSGDIHIQLSEDGKTLWVNAPLLVLRICKIRGKIWIFDDRNAEHKPD